MHKTLATIAVGLGLAGAMAQTAGAPDAQQGGEKTTSKELVPAPQRTDERIELKREISKPDLMPGDKAPEITLGEWIKGEPFTKFEPGKVYVMEYWATWCGPCIAGFPHLSELQEKYGDKVQIVGVNVFERDADYDERVERVGGFVEQRDDMGYSVAIDDQTKGHEQNWMAAAGQSAIPAAFIVDQEGRIAWIGHPMTMDEPLQRVVDGEMTLEEMKKEAEKAEAEQLAQAWAEAIFGAMQEGRWDAAYATAQEKINTVFKDQPEMLNQMAWFTLTHPAFEGHRDLLFAKAAAEQAAKATDRKSADILDTLARAYWDLGDKDKAIETQREAVSVAEEGQMKTQLQATLEEYERQVSKAG